jgi:hypothetical protein
MKEQQFTELPVSSMTFADMVLGTNRLDGMPLCADCQDVFVVDRGSSCSECRRINAELEARRINWVDQAEMGIVPFQKPVTDEPPSIGSMAVVFAGAVISAAIVMCAGWVSLRWLIAFCLKHS